MAGSRGEPETRVSGSQLEQITSTVALLLKAADAILRLFGRRKQDRLVRSEEPDATPPRDARGGELRK